MGLKVENKRYFYRSLGYLEVERFGVKMYRDASMAPGEWHELPCTIDRLIDHLMTVTHHFKSSTLLEALDIQASSVSRVRHGGQPMPLEWLVKMSDYSGLSLRDLREIGGIAPSLTRFDEYSLAA